MSSEEEDAPASPAEKLAISKYFIMDCPPGHVDSVVTALKKLNCADVLTTEGLTPIVGEYHCKSNSVVTLPAPPMPADADEDDYEAPPPQLVVLDKLGQKDESHYYDPTSKQMITIDPVKGTVTEVAPAEAPKSHGDAETLAVLQEGGEAHVKKNFGKNCSAVAVFDTTKEGKTDKYVIVIGAEKQKLNAFWSGRWQGRWDVKMDGKGGAKINGKLSILAHYFEEGNVQLRCKREGEKDHHIDFTDKKDLAEAVYTYLADIEESVHEELDDLFQTMASTTFKAIRRALPINGRKFAWSDYKSYELANARNKVAEMMAAEEAGEG